MGDFSFIAGLVFAPIVLFHYVMQPEPDAILPAVEILDSMPSSVYEGECVVVEERGTAGYNTWNKYILFRNVIACSETKNEEGALIVFEDGAETFYEGDIRRIVAKPKATSTPPLLES